MSLNNREKKILAEVVQRFITHAAPVSSSAVASNSRLGMSPATIRNVMAHLEKTGYIFQPHTSAGRVPKTPAYRVYVDEMMKQRRLTIQEKETIRDSLHQSGNTQDEVLKEVSRIMAQLSHQLSLIVTPGLDQGVFQRMEFIRLASSRMLVVITVQTGFLKTVTLEIESQVSDEQIEHLSRLLNERLHGLKIADIRQKFGEIVRGVHDRNSRLMKMIVTQADRLFDFGDRINIHFTGTHNFVQQADFSSRSAVSSVVELLETGEQLLETLDRMANPDNVAIQIGDEIGEERLQECSIITARYRVGSITGILGVIGPTRLDYSRLVPLVSFTAQAISDHTENN